jgi:hypothetical protein
MGVQIRRIVTGHDASGKAIVKTDEQVTAVPRIAAGISGCKFWSTDRMPIHTWVNNGSVPAVIAFILVDATPDKVNGKEMRTVYPA